MEVLAIANWPVMLVTNFKDGPTVIGVGVGLAASYYFLGNPLDLFRNQQYVQLGLEYALTGVTYVVVSDQVQKMTAKTPANQAQANDHSQ